MKGLMIGLTLIICLLVPASCAKAPPAPAPKPQLPQSEIPISPAENPIIEMHTKTTMAGVARHLTISTDGSIVYIMEEGPRIMLPGSERIRTTRTGQLQEDELDRLLGLFDEVPFDAEGKCNARTETIDTDALSELSVHYQRTTRTIVANYQPLFHDVTVLSDIPESVRKLYQEFRYIVENRTTQVAREKIPVNG